MNKFTGTIKQIQQSGAVLLIDVEVVEQTFSVLLIESAIRPQWLAEGNTVDVVFKESEVSLAKGLSGKISIRNRMNCIVTSINRGELLSTVTMQFGSYTITSAITTRALDSLEIKVTDEIIAFIKSNEITLVC